MCCCRVCHVFYRLQEETGGLTALRATAESAMALHDELAAVYEERLQQDQQLHDELVRWDWHLVTDALGPLGILAINRRVHSTGWSVPEAVDRCQWVWSCMQARAYR